MRQLWALLLVRPELEGAGVRLLREELQGGLAAALEGSNALVLAGELLALPLL